MTINLFLDSGAHSIYMDKMVRNKNASVNILDEYLEEYCLFLNRSKQKFDVIVGLDIVNDPQLSYDNFLKMKDRGFEVLPVVHPGESPDWVDKYLDLGCDYIGLGGLGQFYTKNKYILWADMVWHNKLVDKNGYPKCKVHGFAVTSIDIMMRYPWWSVDSTAWLNGSKFGTIFVPKFRNKVFKYYDTTPNRIFISKGSKYAKLDSKHYSCLSSYEQECVLKYINLKGYELGESEIKEVKENYELKENEVFVDESKKEVEVIKVRGLMNDYILRDEINIKYFVDFQNSLPKWPWPLKRNFNRFK